MTRKIIYPILLCVVLLASCGKQTPPSPAPVVVSNVYRFVEEYAALDSASREQAYVRDSAAVNAFMKTVSEPPVAAESLEAWANSRVVEVFTPAVDSVFADTTFTAATLGRILANAKNESIALPQRKYANVVYGRPESILFVDSTMLIALNHYLGADYPGYSHWPAYMRQVKTPEMLPYDIAEALLGTEYPYKSLGNSTVLSRLIYEGVLAHAKKTLVGDGKTNLALGYTTEQMQWLLDNEKELWNSLVGNKLLFDTSATTADRLFAPAPSVNIITPTAPGRVGRFIGYRIVETYLKKNPSAKLADMLKPEFYTSQSVLADSGY